MGGFVTGKNLSNLVEYSLTNMLSRQITDLVTSLKSATQGASSASLDESTIGINEIVKKAGVFYEKLRYSVDYREEHTIRRSAIERILNRNLLFNKEGRIARLLLEELIRAGYIENHKIPEREVAEVQKIVDRFLLLEQLLVARGESNAHVRKRLLSFAATEIELFFFDNTADTLVLKAFTDTVALHVRLPKTSLSKEDEDTEVYLACRRSLLKSDPDSLSYALWLRHYPEWENLNDPAIIRKIADSFINVEMTIRRDLEEKLGWYLVSKFKNYGIYFSVIKEIVERYGVQSERIFGDPKLFDEEITSILQNRYRRENVKTRKSSVRAIIYIFLTKMILGLALELPYEFFFLVNVQWFAITTNILFHPILLFAITAMITPLGERNTALAISGIHAIVFDENVKTAYIKMGASRGVVQGVFILMYGVIFLISFSIIFFILRRLQFNIVSIALFMFFLTLVSYFGIRIRYNAKRWQVVSGEEGTLAFMWNLFALPIVEVGRWLSTKFQAINIFVFIMDFIIENPFKLILKISDAFVSFVKEKREQI